MREHAKKSNEQESRSAADRAPTDRTVTTNRTGLPDNLKAGVEALSGMSLDQVRVHRNSAKPQQFRAHAYAQGAEIHLAPGQERHLPHEAWHVVQQAQGRVRATSQIQRVGVNDDPHLEAEADEMGARALSASPRHGDELEVKDLAGPVQRKWLDYGHGEYEWDKLQDGGVRWYFDLERMAMFYRIERPGMIAPEHRELLQSKEGPQHAKSREEWLGDPAFHWAAEVEMPVEERTVVDALQPEMSIQELQRIFAEVVAEVDSGAAPVPDYVQAHADATTMRMGVRDQPRYTPPAAGALRAQMNRLAHIHQRLKERVGAGTTILARFYVKPLATHAPHPGINSYAFHERSLRGAHEPYLPAADISELAVEHMKRGHDAPGAKISKSPLVSFTSKIESAMLADSEYNAGKLFSVANSRPDDVAAPSGAAGKAAASAPASSAPAAAPMNSAQRLLSKRSPKAAAHPAASTGKHYSQRIDILLYGFSNQALMATHATAHVASHVAFIAIRGSTRHLYTPENIGSLADDCCTLEAENTIYCPVTDLNTLIIGELLNTLPEIKGNLRRV